MAGELGLLKVHFSTLTKDISQVKAAHTIRPVFDESNLVSAAGLVPALGLAGSAGLYDLLQERVSVPSPKASAKTVNVIGGMLAGSDSIEDLDPLRHGGMRALRS